MFAFSVSVIYREIHAGKSDIVHIMVVNYRTSNHRLDQRPKGDASHFVQTVPHLVRISVMVENIPRLLRIHERWEF